MSVKEEEAKQLVLELVATIEKVLEEEEVKEKLPWWAKTAIEISIKILKLLL